MIAKSRALNSLCAVAPKKPNGRSRKPAWHGSARSVTLGPTPIVHSDDALIDQSHRFRAACRDYRLRQEFITPYTPEQNGIVERFFRSLKEKCVCQYNFGTFVEARTAITQWINGIMLSAHTRLSVIAARGNSARFIPNSWLDSRGAVQPGERSKLRASTIT